MAFSEVFTSLQNGTISAQENPLALIKSANFNEVQKYLNRTDHVRSWIYLTISNLIWDKLSDQDKQAIAQAAKTAQAYERKLFLADEQQLEADLKSAGMTFVDVDQKAFAQKARGAVLANVQGDVKKYVEAIMQ